MKQTSKLIKMSLPHSREELAQRILMGENHHTYHFFHGHVPKRGGVTDRSCLSQWFSASFKIDGVHYATAEHFMMAEKARLFDDESILDDIIHAPHPQDAKALGRGVANFDRTVWDQHSFDIVTRGNVAKFSQNKDLKEYLLGVEESIFVEAAPNDKVWGIGLNRMDRDAKNPFKWRGENKLGFALTAARKVIIQQMNAESGK